ncbi:centrosomal protein of 192 kDa isoform X2 [Sinocyclocheilus anshuiensis]|uniref:centrosomal protein of 192 kDa isoform X2 n=1 Tax=Sinocyclocheilus anshuiensis TaxID=1608454 RepID=UPI0007B88507|nr:PREDICTED: centrosomal protein of 192 kDa-like isoform X2 [Sinocyclocheilus anshuiensis]
MENVQNIEDEPFPSFLSNASLGSSGRTTLGNVTLGSTLGIPMAASTMAKIRPPVDNRVTDVQASYLEDGPFSLMHSQGSNGGREKFVLSLKEDLDNVDEFIAANRFSDLLVNVNLDETEYASVSKTSSGGVAAPLLSGSLPLRTTDLSTGLLSFSHIGDKDTLAAQVTVLPVMEEEEEGSASEGTDSERYSGSIISFLASEKLVSLDSMNSDITDDDIDVNQLCDEELELYFNKLMPPAMQRGRVEGQEIPVELPFSSSQPPSTEPERNRHHDDDYDQRDFHMPDVRLAATGMDSCPASDEEDTEDELEASQNRGRARFLLPSTSRQPVGESHRPHFRPGLEGGSSDDELQSGGRNPDTRTGIEHRRSAEGQVINSPITGDGEGGDGSSGSDEEGNGGVSTIPLPPTTVQSTYDVLRGLGIVGGSEQMGNDDPLQSLLSRSGMITHGQMGDRVGPVGTGEAGHTSVASGPASRCPVNWSMSLDRQEALDAMDNTAEVHLDSVYLRAGADHSPQDISSTISPFLQGTQSSFHLSQVLQESHNKTEQGIDLGHTVDLGALGLRGGPCGDSPVLNEQQSTSSKDQPGESLDARYLSQSFNENHEEHDVWNHHTDNVGLELQQGANATQSVVYQNEEGKWVTDLAYYSSFEKEMEASMPEEVAMPFQSEDFLAGSQAMDKIIEDQKEFEKEHQFIQEEQIQAVNMSEVLGDTSWKILSSSNILMRASQVSSELEPENQSYLRISLGEFFQRRSEALGCLGNSEKDNVKRPSFGYLITSPEKREPFALLRPSDLFSRGGSINIETVPQSDADETLNPDDLDKTLEPNTAEATHQNNVQPQRTEGQVSQISAQYEDKESSGHSSELPNSSSNLMLSIGTIASAIADASISSDPAQLAAMIMELSKRSRSKSRQQVAEESIMSSDPVAASNQNGLLEDLQKTTSVGDLSTPEMEKYLKRAEVSSSDSDGSTSQSCLDILTLADSLATSNKQTQHQLVPLDYRTIHKNDECSVMEEQAVDKKCQDLAGNSSKQTEGTYVVLPNPRSDFKRSAIPRPKSSSLPTATATAHPAKRSLGSGQSSSSSTSFKSKPVDFKSGIEKNKNDYCAAPSTNKSVLESKIKIGTSRPPVASTSTTGNHRSLKGDGSVSSPFAPKTSPGLQSGSRSEVTSLKTSPHKPRTTGERTDKAAINQARSPRSPKTTQSVLKEKIAAVDRQNSLPATQEKFGSPESSASGVVEVTHCNFRPSTSPLTHSSPSQASIPSGNGETSPCSPGSGKAHRSPAGDPGSPQSHCSSPSLSRLTYLSINENTFMPTPDHYKKNTSMALSTTIIRASPTPSVEPFDNGNVLSSSKSPEPLCHSEIPGLNKKTSELGSGSQSDFHKDYGNRYSKVNHQSEPGLRLYPQGDSGYSSKLNMQHSSGTATEQAHQVLPHVLGSGSSFGTADDLTYGPVPSYTSQGALPNLPNHLTGRSLFSSQLAKQYLSLEGPLHAPPYQIGGPSGLYAANPSMGHMLVPGHTSLQSGYLNSGQQHPPQYPVSKTYGQPSVGSWAARDLADLRTQVMVPNELKFPSSCCVGIASQTSLNIFNPSERWQQVSISITSLSIDGEKVESLPFQWLIVKNKTIIGPKCTEEQKVLFIAPRAGLYQYTLSVSSWPASAESETVAHAEVFAKKVVLIAVAENPAIEVDVGKTGCLDFGDLPGGSTKALPLKLVNSSHATVPIRLVISANASAWHCFGFSKSPVAMITDGSLHTGLNLTSLSTSSVINHVLHASYAENQESVLVWVHFSAPQKYISSSGELGPADEYSARVDIEVDSPGPTHVIQSVALRARSGTPRVHAPKDLQTVCLQAPFGQTAKQTLPLKNAGNIDVLLRLKSTDGDSCFTVRPEELILKAGEEQGVVVSFTAQKLGESMLTILVLPSGPQYEVMLKGEVVQGVSGKVVSLPAVLSQAEVPPILSNKQFMAWGGVTLGRAVQQKLVLRNNSPTTSQKLRLLIRGQDQDCFQLQSSFGPDERLTHNRELSIKPKEDVTVRLLFAPTRVASMLAKLEIKQSVASASQPGVKFTIPLSGYGGTSNVILEELRKRSDGYVATLSGVQAGRVCKLCVCVRNTGSRAAFVKAVPYSSLQNRAVMDSTIISLSPSQFVLKERTQEVITIAMKATRREQALCQSVAALLATVCLFCGDEVSRQQFRKLLQIKPEAGNKVLSENSLLKSIHFDEMFLGEEQVQEAYDLLQRPNEAQIFYGNMSKVMLSLFGTMEMSDSGESDHMESVRPSQWHTSESDSGLGSSGRYISNVSLDVLPVKGPPLSPSEPELNLENTWSIKPEQLVLTAPAFNSAADTRHVQILNRSNRELSFELSWPAHCLTITPQHGVIEPQSHMQILISPNPSLATKSSMLPWSGQIYVQCDNQQKSIKVQIQQDLAMDVSATGCAMDRSLCPLPPQAETPTVPAQKPQGSSTQPQVEIKNRTLVFPPTASGESSECFLEVENHGEEVRWYLSSFAPPYVKGVDSSGDVYRATYSAFRCEKVSGTLGIQERMKVPITFLPRDRGDYAQFWDLECHPAAKPQHKSRARFQLCGTGIRAGEACSVKENCSLVKTEATVKNRKRLDSAGSKTGSSTETQKRGVYAPQSLYTFPATRVGATSTLKVNFRNNSPNTHELKFISPKEPFHIKHSNYSLRSQHYINLPVQFVPAAAGQFSGTLLVQTDTDAKLAIELSGEALP